MLVFCVLCLYSTHLSAQKSPELNRILFVFDASGSMFGKWQNKLKIESAKKVLARMVDSLDKLPNVQLALRVYGHQFPRDCKDTKLEVPFRSSNADAIKSTLNNIKPKGITPIAYSLEKAAFDFPKDGKARNTIILITDGIEECGGDPCAVSRAMQENKVILKPFVIGLGINKNLTKKLDCMGRFYNAANEESFQKIMRVILSGVLDKTTVQVNLLDHKGEATETNTTMSFVDKESGVSMYNLVHTLTEAKKPDHFVLDATPIYNLTIQTIPPVVKRNITLKPGEHNVSNGKAAQGYLHLKMTGNMLYKNLKCLIYKAGTSTLVNVQDINDKVKYLEGNYDVTVLTMPKTYLKNVKIASKATIVETIVSPGQVVAEYPSGYVGGVFQIKNGQTVLVKKVSSTLRREYYYLQPGSYKYIVRTENGNKTIYTKSKDFIVKPNGVLKVTI